jgi:hypothetical protein
MDCSTGKPEGQDGLSAQSRERMAGPPDSIQQLKGKIFYQRGLKKRKQPAIITASSGQGVIPDRR